MYKDVLYFNNVNNEWRNWYWIDLVDKYAHYYNPEYTRYIYFMNVYRIE